jgi:hypothetical protein
MKFILALTTLLIPLSALADEEGTARIQFLAYADCIQLTNKVGTTVVLCHQVGGRILSYRQDEKESLSIDPKEAEWTPDTKNPPSSAGRCDIGPEYLIPPRPELWTGAWQSEITGPRSARLTSQPSPAAGVRLIRDFTLDADSSHLTFTQTIENTSDKKQSWCHWSRTFALHGGIGVVPLTPEYKRFPKGYVMVKGRYDLLMSPSDPNIRQRGNFIEILAPPAFAKLGFDTFAGWFAYQMPNDFAFVKTYAASPNKFYGEVAALTLSIYYPPAQGLNACELEPIGPMQPVAPGGKASFTEHWHLIPNKFPEQDTQLDLEALAAKVKPLL